MKPYFNKRVLMVFILILCFKDVSQAQVKHKGLFIAYESLEMAMNKFRNFAGEIGYRYNQKNQLRLTILEVNLTERHLSSSWEAVAVDGNNVKGYLRGYEFHYDRFFSKKKTWYVSASIGYYEDTYEHTILNEKLENRTFTIGSGVGYAKGNLFGVKSLYFNFDMPVRFYFNDIKETKIGETIIRPHLVINNLWLFIGYKFR